MHVMKLLKIAYAWKPSIRFHRPGQAKQNAWQLARLIKMHVTSKPGTSPRFQVVNQQGPSTFQACLGPGRCV